MGGGKVFYIIMPFSKIFTKEGICHEVFKVYCGVNGLRYGDGIGSARARVVYVLTGSQRFSR